MYEEDGSGVLVVGAIPGGFADPVHTNDLTTPLIRSRPRHEIRSGFMPYFGAGDFLREVTGL